jgi:hypothetical protein
MQVRKQVYIPLEAEQFIQQMQKRFGDDNLRKMEPETYPEPYVFSKRVAALLAMEAGIYADFGVLPNMDEVSKCVRDKLKNKKPSKTSESESPQSK